MPAVLAIALLFAAPDLATVERKVFEAINRERAALSLKPLVWNETVAKQARMHSTRMLYRGFFSHVDPDRGALRDRIKSAKIPWRWIGENIATNRGHRNPVTVAVEGWMRSPGHRANILDPNFQQTGVGVAVNGEGEYSFTQIFYTPR